MAVTMKGTVLWDMTKCTLIEVYRKNASKVYKTTRSNIPENSTLQLILRFDCHLHVPCGVIIIKIIGPV
jgi:hypothetical protein